MIKFNNSKKKLKTAEKYIPLGSQTFSKSRLVLPEKISPFFIKKSKDSFFWDVDNNIYIDLSNGLASVTLGHQNKVVDNAVTNQMKKGVTHSLSTELEAKVAKQICDLVDSVEMVRFCKNGTDATSAAIRVARAFTNKKKIIFCGYHGWQDWYAAATSRDLGTLNDIKKYSINIRFNNFDDLKIISKLKDVAAVIMEPMNREFPLPGFLKQVRKLCNQKKIILIFDETITGFRYSEKGAQSIFKINPDLTTFGKGIANGYPLSVLAGRRKFMKTVKDVFFSGTFFGETLSLAAASKTIEVMKNKNVCKKIKNNGLFLEKETNKIIKKNNLSKFIKLSGHPSWIFFNFYSHGKVKSDDVYISFLRNMFRNGIFNQGTHNLSYAQNRRIINRIIIKYNKIFQQIKNDLESNANLKKIKKLKIKEIFRTR